MWTLRTQRNIYNLRDILILKDEQFYVRPNINYWIEMSS